MWKHYFSTSRSIRSVKDKIEKLGLPQLQQPEYEDSTKPWSQEELKIIKNGIKKGSDSSII